MDEPNSLPTKVSNKKTVLRGRLQSFKGRPFIYVFCNSGITQIIEILESMAPVCNIQANGLESLSSA